MLTARRLRFSPLGHLKVEVKTFRASNGFLKEKPKHPTKEAIHRLSKGDTVSLLLNSDKEVYTRDMQLNMLR